MPPFPTADLIWFSGATLLLAVVLGAIWWLHAMTGWRVLNWARWLVGILITCTAMLAFGFALPFLALGFLILLLCGAGALLLWLAVWSVRRAASSIGTGSSRAG